MPPWPPRSTASIGPRRPESDVAGRPGGPVVTSTADLEEGAGPPGGPAPGRVVPASARDDRPGRALGMAGGFGEPGSPGMAGQRRGRAGWPLRSERPVHLRLPAPSLRPRRARSWSRPSQGRCALPFSRVGPPWGVAERPVPVPECPDLPQRSGFCRGVRGESLVFRAFFTVDSASRFLCGRFGQPSARVSPRILARPIGRACLRLMVGRRREGRVEPRHGGRSCPRGAGYATGARRDGRAAEHSADDAGGGRHARHLAVDVGGLPGRVVRDAREVADILEAVGLEVRLGHHHETDLVAHLVEARVVGVVGGPHRVDVVPLHELQIAAHPVHADGPAPVVVVVVAVDAAHLDVRAVEQEAAIPNGHLCQAEAVRHRRRPAPP